MAARLPNLKRDDDIFAEALELPAEERPAFLERVCADATQRGRIEALLAAHDSAGSFLERPVTDRPPVVEESTGTVIGPYTLVRRLGEGGCGIVWLAEQTTPLRRQVALKVIKPGMDSRAVIARFESERQALALMNHPAIAKVYDAGTTAYGRPYFAMEYVEGVPITRFCDEHSLPMSSRLELFSEVCLALQHAHQKGVIHRDLKPSNVLVTLHDGVPAPKVIDFGIAKATTARLGEQTVLTELGLFLGTPAYMSPEQAELRDGDIDTRSDVYSLGTLLYELLTGRPPYNPSDLVRAGVMEIRRIIREVDPPRPSTLLSTLADADRDTVARLRSEAPPRLTAALRGDLDWIVMRCLEKDRDRRYATAAALADDVRRHLRNEPVAARPPHAAYRLKKFIARNRLACASGTALALALIGGVVVSSWQAVRARRAEAVAATERDAAQAARNDAQRRQDQAEALLTFMLGDFRAELQKTGKLEQLDAVAAKAMTYFAELDPRDLTDTALTRQAKALTQLGEVRMEQARYPEAHDAFTASYARAAALVSRHPQNGDMIFERGQAEYWIGFVARRRGDRTAERQWLTRYRDTALELERAEGATARAQLEMVYGHHNLAVLDLDAGRVAQAEAGFASERESIRGMLGRQPDDKDLLYRAADATSWHATTAEIDGRFDDAVTRYRDMREAYKELIRLEPATARWRFEHAQSLTFLGQVELIRGHGDAADEYLASAEEALRELTAANPANKRWEATRHNLALIRASRDLAKPDLPAAERAIHSARQGLEKLAQAEPSSRSFARGLIFAGWLEARLRLAQFDPEGASLLADRAADAARALLRAGPPETWSRHYAAHVLILSGALVRPESDKAKACWSEAVAALGPDAAQTRDWRLLEPLAVALTLSGDAAAAAGPIERLKFSGYRPMDPFIAGVLGPTLQTQTQSTP